MFLILTFRAELRSFPRYHCHLPFLCFARGMLRQRPSPTSKAAKPMTKIMITMTLKLEVKKCLRFKCQLSHLVFLKTPKQ